MAGVAVLDIDLEGVGAVADDAGIVARDVGEPGVVGLARVFVAALGDRAELAGRGREIMDVDEPKPGRGGVFGRGSGRGYRIIHRLG